MELETKSQRLVLTLLVSLLSDMWWNAMAFDITIDQLQIRFSNSKTAFTASSWTDECSDLGLVPTRSYIEPTDVVPLVEAVENAGLTNTPVWAGQSTDGVGNILCTMAFLEPISGDYRVGGKDCSEEAYHLCRAPTPEVRLLSATEALSGANSFLCYVKPSSHSKLYRWYKALSSGTTFDESSNPQLPYNAADASTEGDYWCYVTISQTRSEITQKYHLVATDPEVPTPSLQVRFQEREPGTNNWMSCRTTSVNVDRYIWKKNGRILESFDERTNVAFLFNFTHHDTGNYTCAISVDGVASLDSNEQLIEMIVPKPTLLVAKANLGQSASLVCSTAYSLDVTREFTWYKLVSGSSVEVEGHRITGNTLTIAIMTPFEVGEYTCVETIGPTSSAKATYKTLAYLVPKPTIRAENDYDNVIIGDTVRLICNTGYEDDEYVRSYKWYRNSNDLTTYLRYNLGDIAQSDFRTSSSGFDWTETGSNSTVTIDDFSVEDALKYSCAEVMKDVISQLSEQIELTSFVPVPTFIANTTNGLFGSSVQFVCDIGVEPPTSISFRWYYTPLTNGTIMRTENTAENEMVISSYHPIHVGFYSCVSVRSNALLSATSDWVELRYQVPSPLITAASETVTLGGTFTLTCHDAFNNDSFGTDPFTSGEGISIARSYEWFWRSPSSHITSDWDKTSTKERSEANFRHSWRGQFACVQIMGTEKSPISNWLAIDFSVPQPDLRWPEAQSSIDFNSLIDMKCESSYSAETELSREYKIFYKFSTIDTAVLMATNPTILFHGVQVYPMMSCLEVIEGKESDKSEWLQPNIFVKTPTIREMWDDENHQVEVTCQHDYHDFAHIGNATFTWYDNDIWLSPGAVPDLELNGDTLTGYNIGQSRSGDFSCSLAFFGISSSASTDVVSEEKVTYPTIVSSAQQTVPSGSNVKLLCKWKESYQEKFLWKHNGQALKRTDDNVYRIREFKEANNGDYTCSIRDANNEWKESESVPQETVDPFAVCNCPCDNTTKTTNVTQEEVKEIVSSLKANLTVEKSSLSATIREKTSAPDERISSLSAGAVAISLITGCILLIIIPDAISAAIWIVAKIRYISSSSASVDLVHY